MKTFLFALLSGIVAGGIDILPMVLKKMDRYSILSAFVHWVVLGVIIPYVNWNMHPSVRGLIIAVISAIPIMLIVAKEDVQAVIPMLIFSVILGLLLGFVSSKL
jgi:phosphate starvation-inducible membrane PsiE